ncbi:MAG: SOS response-associated peptidase [Ignavibacteriae bacterium]|nr:SOS response-associated peptidase [Ignavibacteriota bacterium]MCB9214490.1 SOS response-associated peptidase [Ignavibacteria bacterium]
MCGRFSLASDLQEFLEQFKLELPEELLHPRLYNIAPSQPVVGLVADPEPRIEVMEWGFVPSWAKDDGKFKPVINARGESVAEKPYFRGAFRNSRCAILADGFYEWKREGNEKRPHWITLEDGEIFAMAGVQSHRHSPDGSEHVTCAIITTTPNELMKDIHNRMPVILPTEEIGIWLDRETRAQDAEGMLIPYPAEKMKAREVSQYVNNPRHGSAQCIAPVE